LAQVSSTDASVADQASEDAHFARPRRLHPLAFVKHGA
jgi:hypothetical protein